MPEPLSPKSGLGMKVAVLPLRRATLRMMYLASITWSALSTRAWATRSISHWPPVATSWKWAEVAMPHSAIRWAISVRRSARLSVGGQGK